MRSYFDAYVNACYLFGDIWHALARELGEFVR